MTRIVLGGRAETQRWLRLVVLLPALGNQADKAGAGVCKTLQDLDKELCRGEQL
jgi:hypothetical protein